MASRRGERITRGRTGVNVEWEKNTSDSRLYQRQAGSVSRDPSTPTGRIETHHCVARSIPSPTTAM